MLCHVILQSYSVLSEHIWIVEYIALSSVHCCKLQIGANVVSHLDIPYMYSVNCAYCALINTIECRSSWRSKLQSENVSMQ